MENPTKSDAKSHLNPIQSAINLENPIEISHFAYLSSVFRPEKNPPGAALWHRTDVVRGKGSGSANRQRLEDPRGMIWVASGQR